MTGKLFQSELSAKHAVIGPTWSVQSTSSNRDLSDFINAQLLLNTKAHYRRECLNWIRFYQNEIWPANVEEELNCRPIKVGLRLRCRPYKIVLNRAVNFTWGVFQSCRKRHSLNFIQQKRFWIRRRGFSRVSDFVSSSQRKKKQRKRTLKIPSLISLFNKNTLNNI